MLIMGIDPGGTTGVAGLDVRDGTLRCVIALEVTGVAEVLSTLDEHKPDRIVVESFVLYPWAAKALSWDNMVPSQVIGAVKAWACRQKEPVVVVEQPASARKCVKPEVLKSVDKDRLLKGKQHARSAMQHAVLYYWKTWPDDFMRFIRKEVV